MQQQQQQQQCLSDQRKRAAFFLDPITKHFIIEVVRPTRTAKLSDVMMTNKKKSICMYAICMYLAMHPLGIPRFLCISQEMVEGNGKYGGLLHFLFLPHCTHTPCVSGPKTPPHDVSQRDQSSPLALLQICGRITVQREAEQFCNLIISQ